MRPERVERVRDGGVPFRTQSAAAAPAARRSPVGTADAAAAAARRLFRPQHAAHAEDVRRADAWTAGGANGGHGPLHHRRGDQPPVRAAQGASLGNGPGCHQYSERYVPAQISCRAFLAVSFRLTLLITFILNV